METSTELIALQRSKVALSKAIFRKNKEAQEHQAGCERARLEAAKLQEHQQRILKKIREIQTTKKLRA